MAAQSAAWHERRRAGIGSSDIAGILGVSSWATPYSVWTEKVTGGPPDDRGSERMLWGNLLENAVLDEAARRLGVTITARQVPLVHPRAAWARATLDASYDDAGEPGVFEAKTTSDRTWPRVPVHYEAQVQWQLEVAQLPVAWVACLHAGQRLSLWRIERDEETGAALMRIAGRFWERHVVAGVPPAIDSSEATAAAIGRRYASTEPLLVADLTPAAAKMARLREIHDEQAGLKDERRLIENEVKAQLGAAEAGVVDGEVVVTWKPQESRRLDIERLRDEQPRIAEKYTAVKPSRPLRLTGGGGDDA
ncbi:MAG: YqaJ viral recombinase family protein [Actinomycetia bacterium]|nr:YqaJ viral recombinase family protein [Actinomycetes bacterium]